MVMIGGGLLYYLVHGIFVHEQFESGSRFSHEVTPYAAFSVTWWFGIAVGIVMVTYCSYLIVQLLKKSK